MAHNLNITNGKAAMFYSGERPWHGLGTQLDKPATAAEAIVAASLDWQVEPRFMQTVDGDNVEDFRAIIRLDTGDCLGVVGRGYAAIQNAQAFGFFDAVVGSGGAHYHTAGALGKGQQVWMLAQLPGILRVQRTDDTTEKFLLLANSHDGTSSLRMFFTPIRVVCQNTLNVALRSSGHQQGVSIRHTGDIESKVQEAQRALGLAIRYYDDLEGLVNKLASVRIRSNTVARYFESIVPDNPDALTHTRTENIRAAMLRNFDEGRGNQLPGIRGTLWAALNAVTEYVDHQRSTTGETDIEVRGNRLASQWFGSGARMKAKAWNEAITLAHVSLN